MHAKSHTEIKLLRAEPPAFGMPTRIADGLTWVRFPLPFKLDHVNLWCLDDGPTTTLIDTSADTPDARKIWDTLFSGLLKSRRIDRLVATHGHPDHIGLASWLVERTGAEFVCTLAEWQFPQIWAMRGQQITRPEVTSFYRNHGCPPHVIEALHKSQRRDASRMEAMPVCFTRIMNGDTIRFGGRSWRVMVAGGHAEEHASFYCARDGILIAGDQILSRISPVIGVFPSMPKANPLKTYLASLERFRRLPADTLVLPSHGMPFHGLHQRIDQLKAHHAARLDQLIELMTQPHNAYTLTSGLFPEAVKRGQGVLAMAETLAHLNYLVAAKRAENRIDPDGSIRFLARTKRR
jgi:glyoxylase-like metal-dependent hydrolase (beta-lactamase superfamily II)